MRALALPMLLALFLAACQTSFTSNPASPEVGKIIIASDMPLGANADYMLPIQQAIELAISQHPNIEGFKLEYMPMDDALGNKASEEKGAQNVKQMIANPRVLGMIGPANSAVAPTEIQIANPADLVMLSPTSTNDCVTLSFPFCKPQPGTLRTSGRNNYFRIASPDSIQGRAMARFAASVLKVKRVAAFSEQQDVGALKLDKFATEFARTGGTVVYRQDFALGTKDFTAFLMEAAARGADAIYAVSPSNSSGACAAQAQMKSGAYFLVDDSMVSDDCIADASANSAAMFGTIPDVDLTRSNDPAAQKVVALYRKTYPNTSVIDFYTYVFAAYDCTMILIEAITQAVRANHGAIPTRAQVLDVVAHSQFKGVTGTYSFDANGDAVSPLMSIYEVRNGKWVYKQQIDASAART
ncbi:MAG TPA: branched-chain amino acid ABC transporter substrate-binding protein [Candidatus Dormibacteraeota bacterium]|nr:branched-chain amino acid ABC transporter substrate-binding protein [Candidatus Dormibacteraeota bacterium]